MNDGFLVIDAFLDGERVDPRDLKAALALPAGRDYLVDVAAMRDAMGTVNAAHAVTVSSSARPPMWPMLAAAAVACLVIGAGAFEAGRRIVTRQIEARQAGAARAPEPTREIMPTSTYWTQGKGGM